MTTSERRRVASLCEAVADLDPRDPLTVTAAQRMADELIRLVKRGKGPAKPLPGKSIRAKRVEKRAAHREEMSVIREAVMRRAGDHCEACETRAPLEADHMLGGVGRRRQMQLPSTVWALCARCHRNKTNNLPTAEFWRLAFAAHCRYHGYPVPRELQS